MKLHRLRLVNFRGVADREIEFPDSGVVVVEGRNEVGKTSLIEALDLLVDEKDSSKKRHVKAVQPVDSDAATSVEAELSTGPYRFVYRKQWFRQPATELTVLAPRREHWRGVDAHERVRALLAETTDLHLWQTLRLMQATPLCGGDLSGSTALAAALDAAAGCANDAGVEGDSLVDAAERAFRQYFTPADRKPAGEYRTAQARAEQTRLGEQQAQAAVDEVRADVERHARVQEDLAQVNGEVSAAAQERDTIAQRWEAVESLQGRIELARGQAEAARRECDRAVERRDERGRLVMDLEQRTAQLVVVRAEVDGLRESASPQEAALAALAGEHAAANERAATAQQLLEAAQRRCTRVEQDVERIALADRCRKLDRVRRRRAEAQARIERATVDAAVLARIEEASAALELARAAQRAGSTRVHLTGLGEGVTVLVDGSHVPLDADKSVEYAVCERVQIELPGALRVDIFPESGATDLAAEVTSTERALAELLRAAGASDLNEARSMREERRDAEAEARRAQEQWVDVLAGDDPEALTRRLAVLACGTETSEGGDDGDTADGTIGVAEGAVLNADSGAPTIGESDVPTARAAVAQARDELTDTQTVSRQLSAQLAAKREAVEVLRLETARAEAILTTLQGQLDADAERLAAARSAESDAQLDDIASTAAETWSQARRREAALAAELDGLDPESLRVRLDAAAERLLGLEDRQDGLSDELLRIDARLEHACSQGRRERLDAAMIERERAERALTAVRRRAVAARLLYETLERRRWETKRAYVEPFAQAVNRFGRVVYEPGFEVEVAEDLSIAARTRLGRRIDVDALSTGAKEQLAILTRLATASLVDPEQGVPVVIDDALGYTDPERLRLVCAAFNLVGKGAQLVVLSCTPGRYSGIRGAHVIRLGA